MDHLAGLCVGFKHEVPSLASTLTPAHYHPLDEMASDSPLPGVTARPAAPAFAAPAAFAAIAVVHFLQRWEGDRESRRDAAYFSRYINKCSRASPRDAAADYGGSTPQVRRPGYRYLVTAYFLSSCHQRNQEHIQHNTMAQSWCYRIFQYIKELWEAVLHYGPTR